MISEIFELLVNTLTADDKYSLRNSEDFRQPIQVRLSKKQIFFSKFFAKFLTCTSSFEDFRKKHDAYSLCISEITDY